MLLPLQNYDYLMVFMIPAAAFFIALASLESEPVVTELHNIFDIFFTVGISISDT